MQLPPGRPRCCQVPAGEPQCTASDKSLLASSKAPRSSPGSCCYCCGDGGGDRGGGGGRGGEGRRALNQTREDTVLEIMTPGSPVFPTTKAATAAAATRCCVRGVEGHL